VPVIAPRRELFAWAMYDFANSGYTTVVLTTIFNAYFVGWWWEEQRVSRKYGHAALDRGREYSNALVLVSAPVLGPSPTTTRKKAFSARHHHWLYPGHRLIGAHWTGGCWVGHDPVVLSNFTFATGENLIAAFLPEISNQGSMGRVSAYGWAVDISGA